MATTATPQSTTAVAPAPSAKEQFLGAFEQEFRTTMKVLRAYPKDKLELKPAPMLKSARELAWIFVLENGVCEAALKNALTLPPPPPPPVPESWDAILQAIEGSHASLAQTVRNTPDADLSQTFQFYVAPKKLGEVPKIQFLWMMLCDSIHHRGQLTIYTRLAGGVVPSIYGPTLEQAWF
jgi:uncharacterized damage-inducible protein DinB